MERQLFISLLCIIIKNVLLSSKECSVKNSRECSELLLSHEAEVNIKASVIYNNILKEACQ